MFQEAENNREFYCVFRQDTNGNCLLDLVMCLVGKDLRKNSSSKVEGTESI